MTTSPAIAPIPIEYLCLHCGKTYGQHGSERLVCLSLLKEGRRHGFTNYTGHFFEGERDIANPFTPGPVSGYLKYKYPDWEERLRRFQSQPSA